MLIVIFNTFILYKDLLPHATVSVTFGRFLYLSVNKRTVEFSIMIKVQDFLFDMFLFFTPQNWKQFFNACRILLLKNLTYLSIWKLLEQLIHFIIYIIIRVLSFYIESFALQNPAIFKMEIEATEEKVTKQN